MALRSPHGKGSVIASIVLLQMMCAGVQALDPCIFRWTLTSTVPLSGTYRLADTYALSDAALTYPWAEACASVNDNPMTTGDSGSYIYIPDDGVWTISANVVFSTASSNIINGAFIGSGRTTYYANGAANLRDQTNNAATGYLTWLAESRCACKSTTVSFTGFFRQGDAVFVSAHSTDTRNAVISAPRSSTSNPSGFTSMSLTKVSLPASPSTQAPKPCLYRWTLSTNTSLFGTSQLADTYALSTSSNTYLWAAACAAYNNANPIASGSPYIIIPADGVWTISANVIFASSSSSTINGAFIGSGRTTYYANGAANLRDQTNNAATGYLTWLAESRCACKSTTVSFTGFFRQGDAVFVSAHSTDTRNAAISAPRNSISGPSGFTSMSLTKVSLPAAR